MITIIGAGPAGCHTAAKLATADEEVRVIEEHAEIGKPVQCTGIVTPSIKEIVRLPNSCIMNRLRKVRVHAPDGSSAEIKINDLVIDRTSFDQHIAEIAKRKGAEFFLGRRLEKINEKTDIQLRLAQNKKTPGKRGAAKRMPSRTLKTDILIGADGPGSIVSSHIGNPRPDHWIGVQALVEMNNLPVEKDTYAAYFGKELPGFFGWVVPEDSGHARVGIAAHHSPKKVFDRFMKRFDNLKCKVLEMQGGLIPKYRPGTYVHRGDCYLVGDAALQVKATTGGGLVPGMKAAESLSRSITSGTRYHHELHKVNKELRTSLILRRVLDRFEDNDYNELVKMVRSEKMKQVLAEEDRDRPTSLLFKTVLKEPKMLLFAKVLFRRQTL